jgi:hypothetical protein
MFSRQERGITMAGTKSDIFYWSDWLSDPAVRACTLAARGLWIDMLAIMATAKEVGYLMVGKNPITTPTLARMVGASEKEVETILEELLHRAVYNVDKRGVIYSRRMVREEKKRRSCRDGGKKGGRSTYEKQTGIFASQGASQAPARASHSHYHNQNLTSPPPETGARTVALGRGGQSDFLGGGSGGKGDRVPGMATTERIARFGAKIANHLDRETKSHQGSSIVAVAQDQSHPNHNAAITACKAAAAALGKGWPRNWPTDRIIDR